MAGHIIHIFGASGSGTSTLGRYISAHTGYHFMDTDDYFWAPSVVPFSVKRDSSERVALIRREIAAHENVVLSGSLAGWGDGLIHLFTLAIRVETPSPVRLERLLRRERERFGSRIDPGGDMYEIHQAFIEWAMSYDTGGPEIRSKAMHDLWQQKLLCPVVAVDGLRPPEESFESIRPFIASLDDR